MHEIIAGSTDQTIDIFIGDSSSTVGAGLTGLVFNSAGLTCYYRNGATGTATALTLVTQTVGGAHADGGFVEIDATNAPGMYRLDLSDAVIPASSVRSTVILKGATNMAPVTVGIRGVSTSTPPTAAAIADAVWDEDVITAHNTADTAGFIMGNFDGLIVHQGTAQGGGTGTNQIQLDTGASAVDGAYDPAMIVTTGGTGPGQSRLILEYNGTTRVATVDRDWKVTPDATTTFIVQANIGREHVNEGLAQTGAPSTITLNALASASDDAYNEQIVFIRSGTGADQMRLISDYVGATKVATVDRNWDVTPDSTSAYIIYPFQVPSTIDTVTTVTNGVTVTTNNDKTDYALSAAGIDGILDEVVEGTSTMREYLRGMASVLFGESTGGGTATINFENADTPGTNRVVATVDANGNRTAVTLNL